LTPGRSLSAPPSNNQSSHGLPVVEEELALIFDGARSFGKRIFQPVPEIVELGENR
jgi:hypothetical protein